jgi:hypothetical protein
VPVGWQISKGEETRAEYRCPYIMFVMPLGEYRRCMCMVRRERICQHTDKDHRFCLARAADPDFPADFQSDSLYYVDQQHKIMERDLGIAAGSLNFSVRSVTSARSFGGLIP